MLCSMMVPVQPSGPYSDAGWMQRLPWPWRAQTQLGFHLQWMDRLGSRCLVGFYCGKGCYISTQIGLQHVSSRCAAWGGISP